MSDALNLVSPAKLWRREPLSETGDCGRERLVARLTLQYLLSKQKSEDRLRERGRSWFRLALLVVFVLCRGKVLH